MSNWFETYKNNGFFVYTSIYNKQEIDFLRKSLEDEYKKIDFTKRDLKITELKNNDLTNLILKGLNSEKIQNLTVDFSRKLNTQINILPNFFIMRNYHVDISRNHGWHRDCGGELEYSYCKNILSKDDYFFSKCAIFLQENSNDYGGAIDVLVKSNKNFKKEETLFRKIKAIPYRIMTLIHKINKKIYSYLYERSFSLLFNSKTLKPNPGDLVVFDSRTIHRATVANNIRDFKGNYEAITPESKIKYAIYCHFGSSDGVDSYMYDRLKRENNLNEFLSWFDQAKFIKNYDLKLYENIIKILNPLKNKYQAKF